MEGVVLGSAELSNWSPNGAIWYAHACCSAGSDSPSRYADLVAEDADVGSLTRNVSRIAGARMAALPRALLGKSNPLRAFVGHVEPTFSWTLRDPTGAVLPHTIVHCLYDRLHQAKGAVPIGWAMSCLFREAESFLATAPDKVAKSARRALYDQMVGLDRQSTVILGDPAVSLSGPSR